MFNLLLGQQNVAVLKCPRLTLTGALGCLHLAETPSTCHRQHVNLYWLLTCFSISAMISFSERSAFSYLFLNLAFALKASLSLSSSWPQASVAHFILSLESLVSAWYWNKSIERNRSVRKSLSTNYEMQHEHNCFQMDSGDNKICHLDDSTHKRQTEGEIFSCISHFLWEEDIVSSISSPLWFFRATSCNSSISCNFACHLLFKI